MTGVFLQLRLDSSRLPRKAMLDLAGKPVVEHVLAALSNVTADLRAVLTDESSFDELAPHARAGGFEIMAGPRDDVLARYAQAIRRFNVDTVIRATGDNPVVSWELADMLNDAARDADANYAGYLNIPYGCGVEVIGAESLLEADRVCNSSREREHVCPYLYNNPDRFSIMRKSPPVQYTYAPVRVTLDTWPDYIVLKKMFKDCFSGSPLSYSTVRRWLDANSQMLEISA